ncbi:Zn(II)2Cys6 transcription factor, partial [Aspergillus thermomutatus]
INPVVDSEALRDPMQPSQNPQSALRASCESCRKAKVRCRREGASCSRCMEREQKCEFSPSSRKRSVKGQPTPHRDTIDEMKNRLERMESLLLARRRSSADDSKASSSVLDNHENDASYCLTDCTGFSSFIGTPLLLIIPMAGRKIHSVGPGSASGFGLFSPRGLQWVSSITHSTELLEFLSNRVQTYMIGWSEEMMSTWQHLGPDGLHFHQKAPPSSQLTVRSSLCTTHHQQADSCADFFAYVNSSLPLFNQERFMELFNSQYSGNPPTSVAWYASLNAVLGMGALVLEDEIGMPSAVLHPRQDAEGGGHVLSCLRNCYSVFTQLSYSCREVMGVQALIGMAMILEFLLDAEASYMAIGSAARLALGLGLNRDCGSEFSRSELEERRSLFRVGYVVDRALSFRLGRPPTISDEDIQVSEPPSGKFAHLVKLIRIESEIYTRLYSVRARSPERRAERLAAEDELYQKLVAWQYSLPDGELRPGQLMLWRLNIGADTSSPLTDPRWSSKRIACLSAARNTIKLLDSLREGGELFRNNLARRLSYYPLSAFLELFINTLLYPRDPSALADLDWLRVVVNLMSGPLTISSSPLALLFCEIFEKMTKTAEDFLARTLSGGTDGTAPFRALATPKFTSHDISSTIGSPFGAPRENQTLGGLCPQLPPPFSDYALPSYDEPAPTREGGPLAKVRQILSTSDVGASETFFARYETISSEVQGVDSGLSSPSLHHGWRNPTTLPEGSSSFGPPS